MTVTAVTPQKRRPGRSSVFVDGEFVFGMSNEDLTRLSLSPGAEVTREQLNKWLAQVVLVNARDAALRYLNVRPRTFREVEKRLKQEAYPPKVIARVMMLMEKYRYIDDAQYARDYAEERLRPGQYGPRRVKRELILKGIDEKTAEEAVHEFSPDRKQVTSAREYLRQKHAEPGEMDAARRKRVTDAMLRRGFSFNIIKEALTEAEE